MLIYDEFQRNAQAASHTYERFNTQCLESKTKEALIRHKRQAKYDVTRAQE